MEYNPILKRTTHLMFDVGVPSISLFRGDFTLYVSYTIAHFRWLLNEEMLKT